MGRGSVLVVEANFEESLRIYKALKREGFNAVVLLDAATAAAEARAPGYALVLLDAEIPGAVDVLRALSQSTPRPLLGLMASKFPVSGEASEAASEVGGYVILKKPIQLEPLMTLVRTALDLNQN